ncbi:MAG TPA: nuclear transport factor 2 family protein [Candidatus Agrococcus pullicola]|uniref:Nuclear transport factor 2 family protein n=1 Tax=Candidatus Agrococcus pullicola TaxID=2838429 RepID=A0A9D2CAD0_9MICO|nr:nuclear transport factor 2 family protein [Candidatus Agrococcus pullicola]
MQNIVDAYLATWNADAAERERLIAEHWAENITYADPQAEIAGSAALHELIGAVRAQFPDFFFSQYRETDAHHRQLRFSWGLGPEGEEPPIVGFDVVVLDEEGKISDVRGFLDRVPQ